LQVRLIWTDDANPNNNLGQSNTDVKALNSPHAQFTFPLRNATRLRQQYVLRADAYTLPGPRPCGDQSLGDAPQISKEEAQRRMRQTLAAQGYETQALPAGWRVAIAPAEITLGGGEEAPITVDINSPDGYRGQMSFNVNAFAGAALAGGVTLSVTGDGT
jgi:hypothetical protein